MKTIYFLDAKIKWKAFKKLQDLVKLDIKPMQADKVLWQMLRDRQISCWFLSSIPNDMQISLYSYFPKKYLNKKKWKIVIIK